MNPVTLATIVASGLANRALETALAKAFLERGARLFVLRRESLCKAIAVFEYPAESRRGWAVEHITTNPDDADEQLYKGLIAALESKLARSELAT